MPRKDPDARREYHREYMRQWYENENNREIHLARVKKGARERRQRMNEFIDSSKRCPCFDCGGRFPTFLMDFDHVRGTKVAIVSRLGGNRASLARVAAEIAKCEVVCSNCHRFRTQLRREGGEVKPSEVMQRLGAEYVSVLVYA
jgi:hypothetical protein